MRVIVLAAALLATAGRPALAQVPDKKDPPGLPAALLKSWKAANAELVWMDADFHESEKPTPDAIPLFRKCDFAVATLAAAKRPLPAVPFGLGIELKSTLAKLADHEHADKLSLVCVEAWLAGEDDKRKALLKDLAALKNLTRLRVEDVRGLDRGQKVTAAHFKEFAALPNLTHLSFGGEVEMDTGLKELAALKSLTHLDLGSANVTKGGWKELAALKTLTRLDVHGGEVAFAGLKDLAALDKLAHLGLVGSARVSLDPPQLRFRYEADARLKDLAALKALTRLDLVAMKVTDAGLKELAGLGNLTRLRLFNTSVTKAQLAELRKALPKCEVSDVFR